MAREDSRTTARGSANDWHLLLQTIRSLMICEETMRLYPEGHQRAREAIKSALSRIQEYHATTRRVFTFVPELALDVSDLEGSRGAKDVITLANCLREHLIQRLAIHPEVDCESLEALLRHLQSSPPAFEKGKVEKPEWPHIEIELFRDGADDDGYRFNKEGEQLVRAPSPAERGLRMPANLPPSLRKNLARIFADPEIRESLERLQSRLGGDAPSEGREGGGDAGERIELVGEIVESLFGETGALVDTPQDVLTGKLHDFLRFVEGLAPALPASGDDAPQLTPKEVRALVARAAGMQYREQAGVAEIYQQSERLKALLSGTGSFRLKGAAPSASSARPPPSAQEEKGKAKSRLRFRNNDPSSRAARRGGPPSKQDASVSPPVQPDREEIPDEPSTAEAPCVSPDFSSRRAAELYRQEVIAHFDSFDYDLEALRIRTELLAAESGPEAYRRKRDGLLEHFGSRKWLDADEFNDELDATVGTLAPRESDGGLRLAVKALALEGSQEVIDSFFRRRVDRGASIDSLRPFIRELAAEDVARPAGALTSLWRKADRRQRDEYIDEVYGLFALASKPDKLARWARDHAAVFSTPRSLAHLRSLTARSLEKIFREITAPGGDSGRGSLQAASALLDAVGGDPEHEGILLMALRRGSPQMKKKALTALDGCVTREMLDELTAIVETENEKEKPDLDRVHLALTAMVKSYLPHARDRLRRFRTERRLLRHVYRSDIRKILDLLCRMDGVTL